MRKINVTNIFNLGLLFTLLFSNFSYTQDCNIVTNSELHVGQEIEFNLQCTAPGFWNIRWEFGDGDTTGYVLNQYSAKHTYQDGGVVFVFARIQGQLLPASQGFTILFPITPKRPSRTTTILFDKQNQRVWSVNPDNHTVTAVGVSTLTASNEIPVGKRPRTLTLDSNNQVWICNQKDATLTILNAGNSQRVATVNLPHSSMPYGVTTDPDGKYIYVSLQGAGQLVKIDAATRAIANIINIGPFPRAIAISQDGKNIYVTRWISSISYGEIYRVDAVSFTKLASIQLSIDVGPDSDASSRGLPNALNDISITPDGRRAWVTAKKDNFQRGILIDGQALDFQTSVRTIICNIDLATHQEVLSMRLDPDDQSMAYGIDFDSKGKYGVVTHQTSNEVMLRDGFNMESFAATGELDSTVELAPEGVAFDDNDSLLFVQYLTTRIIGVYDVSQAYKGGVPTKVKMIPSVKQDSLHWSQVLGKQVFYNSRDSRMSRDKYITCNVCHLDGGGHDGRNYDRGSRGEGLRNTTTLFGRGATDHGLMFWTATSDEIQDSEGGLRTFTEGTGFLSDADFNKGTRSSNLGDPKTGFSLELDALAMYLKSLKHVPNSPYRNPDGTMTADALQGKVLFEDATIGCAECHAGQRTTISSLVNNQLFDVGTITQLSGKASGQTLTGFDVPTVNGVWNTAPFLHDGSAATLMDVLVTKNAEDKHGVTSHLNPTQLNQLVAYMLQADDREKVIVPINKNRKYKQPFKIKIVQNFNGNVLIDVVGFSNPEIKIFNGMGKIIEVLNNSKFISENHWKFNWHFKNRINSINKGIYFVKVSMGNYSVTKKFFITK